MIKELLIKTLLLFIVMHNIVMTVYALGKNDADLILIILGTLLSFCMYWLAVETDLK